MWTVKYVAASYIRLLLCSGSTCGSFGWLVSPPIRSRVATTIGWSAMKFGADVHGP